MIGNKYIVKLTHLSAVITALLFFYANNVSAACSSETEFAKAYQQGNTAKLRAFATQLDSCKQGIKDKRRYYIANALYEELAEKIPEDKVRIQDYAEILSINPDFWKALVDTAEIALNAKDYQTAFKKYESALVAIEHTLIDIKIPTALILEIKDQADNARLLASLTGYIEPTQTRDASGKPEGMHSFQVRGVEISCHKYPIRFAYNQDILQGNDLKNAEQLYSMLHANNDPDINLTGHTDYKGTDAYNLKLSRKRANQVKDFLLLKKNYGGDIKVIAMGKRQPIKIHSKKRLQLSDREWRALNRRVESCKQ